MIVIEFGSFVIDSDREGLLLRIGQKVVPTKKSMFVQVLATYICIICSIKTGNVFVVFVYCFDLITCADLLIT